MIHQDVTLVELVFQFFNKAKDNASTDNTVGDDATSKKTESATTPKTVGGSDCKSTKGDTCLNEIKNCVNFWCNAKGKSSSEAIAQCDSENQNANSRTGIRVKCGGCTISNKNDYVCKGSDDEKSKPKEEVAACSSTCMQEVTKHCMPNIQCKKPDVSTLAAAAQKCQEEINAQSTGIKAKCPEPCKVSDEVLNQGGACPENNDSDDDDDDDNGDNESTEDNQEKTNQETKTCACSRAL